MPLFSSRPKKEFFVFDKPMSANGRECNLLGVVVEEPKKGTGGRYTPQGPDDSPNSNSDEASLAPVPPPTQETTTYRTPCAWPSNLGVRNIYPNEPTIAVGVEEIRENVKGVDVAARILKAISFGLKVDQEKLDTVTIPILRRHSMEDPAGKIEDLLGKKEYRERVINLFGRLADSDKKELFVVTNIVACAGVSVNHVRSQMQRLSGHAEDPTQTVPLKLSGELEHLKKGARKGEYESEIILCMSYHRITYECPNPVQQGKWFFGKPAEKKIDPDAIVYKNLDGSDCIFKIDRDETDGEVPAFMGRGQEQTLDHPRRVGTNDSLSDSRKPSIFEDAILSDSGTGAE